MNRLYWRLFDTLVDCAFPILGALLLAILTLTSGCADINAGYAGVLNAGEADYMSARANVQRTHDGEVQVAMDLLCNLSYGSIIRNASEHPGLTIAIERACGIIPADGAPTAFGNAMPIPLPPPLPPR